MTKTLYLTDCYLKEFDAKIVDVLDDGTLIMLDQTAFYPTSGGQPNDLGSIKCNVELYNVIDVFKRDGEILHKVDRSGLKKSDAVICEIDWERRYVLMRYHTAAHILSTLINSETGAEITGNQLYIDRARVDFSLEKFDRSLMIGFEEKANAIIMKGLTVNFRLLDREDALKIPSLTKLRMQLPETITQFRIVDIFDSDADFDHQACGGTHIQNTQEIGSIKIFDLENKGRDRKRIYFRLE